MLRYLASFILVGFLLATSATARPQEKDRDDYNLMLLYSNDVQGKIAPCG